MKGRDRGFSLVEVMIALMIISIALIGLMRTLAFQADQSAALKVRTFAQWAGLNAVAEQRLLPNKEYFSEYMGGHDWAVFIKAASGDASLQQRLDVSVFQKGDSDVTAHMVAFRPVATGEDSP